MRPQVPLLVGLALLLAGCTGPTGGDPASGGLGGDGEAPSQPEHFRVARWNQSGLVEAFPNASDAYEIRPVRAGEGIPFQAPNLTDREGPIVLRQIVWNGPGQQPESLGREQFRVEDNGTVRAILEGDRNTTQVRGLFETFVQNITDANRSTIDRWSETFLASEHEVGTASGRDRDVRLVGYQVDVDEPLAIDPLVARLEAGPGQVGESPTGLSLENETWRLRFEIPHTTAARQEGGTFTELTATHRGRVVMTLGTQGNLTADEVKDHARRTFEDLGLPEPTFDGFSTRSFQPR